MSFEDGDMFAPFTDNVPHVPIERLRELQRRAKWLLRKRTTEQLKEARKTIEWLIEEYFYKEKEKWIYDQLERGGSVLRFLKYEDRTTAGLRELVDHSHDPDITCEFDFPSAENTSELEALENSLSDFDLDDEGFPEAQAYEYLAVLALVQIASALNVFFYDEWPPSLKEDVPIMSLMGIANDAINIMETVCSAEALQDKHQVMKRAEFLLRDNMNNVIPAEAEALARKKMSLTASKAASIRHKENREQKAAILAEWEATGSQYNSRADFARIVGELRGIKYRTLYDWIAAHEKTKP
ncbi:hypothetical protein HA520_05220 [Azotobacter chroococcum]|uniref:Uncharacterized protein n=1 Tax=Azotobacter chroococcum TaxID=353 RepID=A0AA43Z5I6_9GAMM|nr:hypothetical protein [Azotobacter chroococcum]NHN76689.1 hypothetical protein [Azotobacter chroococcum]